MVDSVRIAAVLELCPWARDSADLFRVVPELGVEAPPMTTLSDGPAVLLPEPGVFLAGITTTLCQVFDESLDPEGFVDAGESTVRADEVVSVLLPLWMDCRRPGIQVQALPALAVAWATSALVAGEAPWLAALPGPLAEKWARLQSSLTEMPAEQRYAIQRRIASRMSARIGAALTLARAAGVAFPSGGLVRRLMTNPLLFVYPYGKLDPAEDLAEVGGLLNAPMDSAMLTHLVQVTDSAWQGVLDRLNKRKSGPVDRVLQQLVGRKDAIAALLDPVAGPILLRSLPSLVDVKFLRNSGLDARVARDLLTETALRPLAAAWRDLVGPLREWQVMSALCHRIAPIWPVQEGWQIRHERYPPQARWSLRVPQRAGSDHAVVAVRMSEVVGEALSVSLNGRDAAKAVWIGVLNDFQGAVSTWVGDVGLSVFAGPEEAVCFAERIHAAIPGADGILCAGEGSPRVAVPPDMRVGVGMAWGRVDGGTDGESVWLDGLAVGRAMALTGRSGPTLRTHDPLNIRVAVGEPTGLRSDGIVAAPCLVEALRTRLNHPLHAHGSGEEVAGICEDFHFYPVPYWWQANGEVRVWLELGGRLSGGPCELATMNRVMFRDIHQRDQDLEKSDIQEPEIPSGDISEQVAEAVPEQDSGWDPFGALSRAELEPRDMDTEDPWAQLEDRPQLEIDDA